MSDPGFLLRNIVTTLAPPCQFTSIVPFQKGYLIRASADVVLGNEYVVQNEIDLLCALVGKEIPVVLEIDICYYCRASGVESTLDDDSVYTFLDGIQGCRENIRLIITYSSENMDDIARMAYHEEGSCAWEVRCLE